MATNPSTSLKVISAQGRNQAPAVKAVEFDVGGLMELQQAAIRRRDYAPLGQLRQLMLGPAVGLEEKGNPLTRARYATGGVGPLAEEAGQRVPLKIEWREVGPLLALSKDSQDVLIIGRCPHPPRIPPYDWAPPAGWAANARLNERGLPVPPQPPLAEQRLRDRACGVIQGAGRREFLVIQPVTQILALLPGKTGLVTVRCIAEPVSGRSTAFLYDPKNEEGFFLFGLKDVTYYQ